MGIFAALAVAAIKVGGSILASSKASKAATEAAELQSGALESGIEEQQRQFDLTRGDFAPFLETGTQADLRLRNILLGGTALNAPDIPGLERAKQAGLEAVEGSAFAKRQGLSGRTLASLFNQGQAFDFAASTDFLNRLQSLSGRGQTAAAQVGGFGAQKASNVANLLSEQGDVRASGTLGRNRAFQAGVEGVSEGFGGLFESVFGGQS